MISPPPVRPNGFSSGQIVTSNGGGGFAVGAHPASIDPTTGAIDCAPGVWHTSGGVNRFYFATGSSTLINGINQVSLQINGTTALSVNYDLSATFAAGVTANGISLIGCADASLYAQVFGG